MESSFNKVWVKGEYASRIIRSTLNSDSEITDAYKYGAYDNIVDAEYAKIGGGKLFKLEYGGNLAGYYVWSGTSVVSWFLKPNFRTEDFLKMLNFAVSETAIYEKSINQSNLEFKGNEKLQQIITYKS